MKLGIKHTTAIATALAIFSVPAFAATVSSVEITTTGELGASVQNASTANGTASVSGPNTSVATQNADGTSEVEAATASFGQQKVVSSATFEQSETNTSGMDRDYTLSYNLVGQSADFDAGFIAATRSFDLAAATVTATTPTNPSNPFVSADNALPDSFTRFAGASFEYNIFVNGDLKFNARADALLDGGSPFGGPEIDVESNFNASINGFTFIVDGIADDIFLGTYGDGQVIDVVSTLTARAYTPGGAFDGFQIGVNSFSSDPITLSSVGILSNVATPTTGTPSTVPLPAAGWLLIAGLGGLAAARRRKS